MAMTIEPTTEQATAIPQIETSSAVLAKHNPALAAYLRAEEKIADRKQAAIDSLLEEKRRVNKALWALGYGKTGINMTPEGKVPRREEVSQERGMTWL